MGKVCLHAGQVVYLKTYQDTEHVHVHNLVAYHSILVHLANLELERRLVGRSLKLQLPQNTLALRGVFCAWAERLQPVRKKFQ